MSFFRAEFIMYVKSAAIRMKGIRFIPVTAERPLSGVHTAAYYMTKRKKEAFIPMTRRLAAGRAAAANRNDNYPDTVTGNCPGTGMGNCLDSLTLQIV